MRAALGQAHDPFCMDDCTAAAAWAGGGSRAGRMGAQAGGDGSGSHPMRLSFSPPRQCVVGAPVAAAPANAGLQSPAPELDD